METINGRYYKIDNLDDALRVAVDKFAALAEADSTLLGARDEIQVNEHQYSIEIKYKKEVKDV